MGYLLATTTKQATPPAAAAGGLALAAPAVKRGKNARKVSRGRARFASGPFPDPEHVLAGLSKQQRAVAGLVAQGLTNPEIAERLHLSPHTVRNYLARVMGRLGVHNRTAVAVILTQLQSQYPAPKLAEAKKPALARKTQSNPLPHAGRSRRRLAGLP